MKKILIDCDPGHDDALALFMASAFPDKLEILAVSTVGGNQKVQQVTRNAANLLTALHQQIPLIQGIDNPLVKEIATGDFAHGTTGMDGPEFEPCDYPVIQQNPILCLYSLLMGQAEKTTIVALGPLTNIALLIKAFPDSVEKIEAIAWMGGGTTHGNMTAAAEFNSYVDPEAAQIVFTSGLPIVMAGLDVTEKSTITKAEFDSWQGQGPLHQLSWELLNFYYESGKQFGFTESALHDVVPVAYLLEPELFKGQHYSVDIVLDGPARGMTLADKRIRPDKQNQVFVLESVDRTAFVELMNTSLTLLDEG